MEYIIKHLEYNEYIENIMEYIMEKKIVLLCLGESWSLGKSDKYANVEICKWTNWEEKEDLREEAGSALYRTNYKIS